MKIYQKFIHLCILQVLLVATLPAGLSAVKMTNSYLSRMAEVMYKGFGGIEEINHKIQFAFTKNLSLDLNIAALSKKFGCKTKLGQDFIAFYLDKVISPADTNGTIAYRQNMIRMLMNRPELLAQFKELIEQAHEYEPAVIDFMARRVVVDQKYWNESPFGYIFDWIQKNKYTQTLQTWWSLSSVIQTSTSVLNNAWSGVKLGFNGMISLPSAVNYAVDTSVNFDVGAMVNSTQKFASDIILATPAFMATSAIVFFDIPFLKNDKTQKFESGALGSVSSIAMKIIAAYGLYQHYNDATEKRKALYSLEKLIQIAQKIESICDEYKVDHQFKASAIRSEMGCYLLDELASDRYQEIDSAFFWTTSVKTFMYEVYEYDNYFAPIYASIAEIDAYVALATKMLELADTDHRFCFTQFLDYDKPTIQSRQFWNLLVSVGKIVPNDLIEDRNIILTGSNEGGKTTAIRAILQNIVLAQTFGIAAAEEFKLTPFSIVQSFLNISDDILTGKSRFASELRQAQEILEQIKCLQPKDKFFFALDELFTGTNGEDGAECAYRFINNIAGAHHTQFIYATHFNRLKTIGQDNPACVNYKIDPPLRDAKGRFIRNIKGQLIYPYTLSQGANNVNVAMDRATDAGIFG